MNGPDMTPHRGAANPYLIASPHVADRGEKIGSNPAFLSVETLRGLGQPETPMKAVRAHCVGCCGGSYAEANKCTAIACPLWPYRMGRNPFHARSKTRKPATAVTVQASIPTASNVILGGLSDE